MTFITDTSSINHYLCFQGYMFDKNYFFNQDISNWDVSKGVQFVSVTMTCEESNLIEHKT